MPDAPTHAELAMVNPNGELRQDVEDLRAASLASQSESRKDRHFEDGSVLVMRSRLGGEVNLRAFATSDEAAAPQEPLADSEA